VFEFRGRAGGLLRNTNIWELDLIFISHLANNKETVVRTSRILPCFIKGVTLSLSQPLTVVVFVKRQ